MPKRTAHVFEDKWRSDDVKQQEAADFSSLLLSEKVLLGLKKAGFKTPSPIQLEAIPVGRVGNDLIVQAKSGTGKTLVFTIIALDLLTEKKHPQTLILAPTREIAFQICEVIKSVSSSFKYLKCGAFIGGIPIEEDRQNILGCQIVVGTPGRIKQLIQLRILLTAHIRIFVLDEADQLLEKSFQSDIDAIFVALPAEKQIITTSATYPKSLKKLVARYFKANPYVARLNVNDRALLGTMHYMKIVEVNPMPVLAYRAKMRALENVLTSVNFSQCLVFCNAVSKVEPICDDIKTWGFSSTYISSAKEQSARLKAIECLKRFKCKVLVSSDVSSRGIDAENVDLIINIDVPSSTEVYLHRVGRAGRFGSKGLAVTFVPKDQIELFKKIQKSGNFKAYFLPDPIPENLIHLQPDKEAEFKGDSTSESSEDEQIPSDKKSCKPILMQNIAAHISNGKSVTRKEKKIRERNILNSEENSTEKESLKDRGLESSESDNSSKGSLVDSGSFKESSTNTEKATPVSPAKDAIKKEDLCSRDVCKDNSVENKENIVSQSEEIHMSLESTKNEDSLVENKENIGFQSGEIDMSSASVEDKVSLEQLPISKRDQFSFELSSSSSESKENVEVFIDSETPSKDLDDSSDTASSSSSESNENLEFVDSPKTCQKENFSRRMFYPGLQKVIDKVKSRILAEKAIEAAEIRQRELERSEKCTMLEYIGDPKDMLEVKDESGILQKESVNKEKVKGSCSSDSEVNLTKGSDSPHLDKIYNKEGICIGEINIKSNSVSKNEIVKNVNDSEVLNSSKTVPVIDKPVSDRKSLSNYYSKVYEAYRKDNIEKDPIEILEFMKNDGGTHSVEKSLIVMPEIDQNSSTVKDVNNCSIIKTTEGVKSSAKNENKKCSKGEAKMDLNAWSLKLASEKLSEVDSDTSEDSTDTSSECVRESTPIKTLKVKNSSLDVSCDTPPLPNPVPESNESDTSSNSEYSNKCQETLAKSLKMEDEMYTSDSESSSSDSESSSSDSDDSTEMTLLERANKEMLEKTNCEKMSLAERADIFRKVLLGLEKDGVVTSCNDSVSDIQILKSHHSPKALSQGVGQNASNIVSDRQCGFLASFQGNRKPASNATLARDEKSAKSLKSTKPDHSSKARGKFIESSQRKIYRISSSSDTSSDDSDSSLLSATLQDNGNSAANENSYTRLTKLSNAKKSSKADCSSVKARAFQRKVSSSSETSSDDITDSGSSASESCYSAKQKRSKNNVHSRSANASMEYSGTSFLGADQSNCFGHPGNRNSHYFNPQGGLPRNTRHFHEHNNVCSLPSQHQCHAFNGDPVCQSQSCATWYDLFYKQWNFIHQSSYFK